jgi:hypothetical protein
MSQLIIDETEIVESPETKAQTTIEVPVGFVPTPTLDYRIHRRTRKATMDMQGPSASAAAGPVPGPIPVPIPIPWPILQGARVLMYKQDPTVQEIGLRKAFLPDPVLAGPKDARIIIQGMPVVTPNVFGDMIETPNTDAFDSVHTFAVVRQTLNMYQRALESMVPWQWNSASNIDKLQVFPHAGVTQNAFYSRSLKALKFFYFTATQPAPPHTAYTCRSLDIVGHETGHAILDGLKPNWLVSSVAQTGALHEAFGDLTSIFLVLSQFDLVDAVIVQTKANLHNKTFLSDLAEEFGLALGRTNGLRNADNDLKLSQVTNEVHDLSQCFTGAIYDVLADWFAFKRSRTARADLCYLLYDTAQELRSVLLKAIKAAPAVNATFTDLANQMLNVCAADSSKPVEYRTAIRNQFTRREIVVQSAPLAMEHKKGEMLTAMEHPSTDPKFGQNRMGCCGTMQLPEYANLSEFLDREEKELKKVAAAA